jgi:F0F1-type ATP synthase assembly protein I
MMMLKEIRNQALKLITLQFISISIIAFFFWIFGSWHAGWSSFLGGLAGAIPSIYFVWKFFSNKKRLPLQIVKDFFVGEIIKISLGAVFLILAVRFLPVLLLPLLIGYIGAYFSIWLVPIMGVK